jgi:hypothetical protein
MTRSIQIILIRWFVAIGLVSVALSSEETRSETVVSGTAAAVRVEAVRSPLQEVLAELSKRFNFGYRSSVSLNETIDGAFQGNLNSVIARLLTGHNYIVKRENSYFEIVVLGSDRSPNRASSSSAPSGWRTSMPRQ